MNVAINSNLNALEPTPIGQFVKTATTGGTAERLVATPGTFFRKCIVLGKKAYRTDNTDNVFLGASGTSTNQPYLVAPGDVIFFELPVGARDDFYNWYVNPVVNGEGVAVIYW